MRTPGAVARRTGHMQDGLSNQEGIMHKGKSISARVPTTRPAILDSVGLVRRANGSATLRLKVTGNVRDLAKIRLVEGDRLRVHQFTIAAA